MNFLLCKYVLKKSKGQLAKVNCESLFYVTQSFEQLEKSFKLKLATSGYGPLNAVHSCKASHLSIITWTATTLLK